MSESPDAPLYALVAQLKQLPAHSTREIARDAGDTHHGHRHGWNPSWVKHSEVMALLDDLSAALAARQGPDQPAAVRAGGVSQA